MQGRAFAGLFVLVAIAWALGPRNRVPVLFIGAAIALQFVIAVFLYSFEATRAFLASLTSLVQALQEATTAGTSFVFGYVGGGEAPFLINEDTAGNAFIFGFQALPMVIVLSAISALLWRWRILEFLVRGFAVLFKRALNLSGAASLGAAANIFLGMTESPVLIRPRLPDMSRSDLFLIMTVGLSTVAGSVMAIYVAALADVLDGAAGHIFTASLISIPAAVLLARVMVPPEGDPKADASDEKIPPQMYRSSIDALTTGVTDGVRLFVNIIAMLLVFIALVTLVDMMLGLAPDVAGAPLSVDRVLGWIFAPIVWLVGISWQDAQTAGSIMGIKTALNEVVAYIELGQTGETLSERSRLIMTYAVCGFANFSSVGIMIGGMLAIAPSRREDILDLAPKALISGTLATLMTGGVVGALPAALFG